MKLIGWMMIVWAVGIVPFTMMDAVQVKTIMHQTYVELQWIKIALLAILGAIFIAMEPKQSGKKKGA
jgi:hypothetical protein